MSAKRVEYDKAAHLSAVIARHIHQQVNDNANVLKTTLGAMEIAHHTSTHLGNLALTLAHHLTAPDREGIDTQVYAKLDEIVRIAKGMQDSIIARHTKKGR